MTHTPLEHWELLEENNSGIQIHLSPSHKVTMFAGSPENARFIFKAVQSHDDLLAALDPNTLEAIADEIDCFEHSARAHGLRGIAKRQRAAIEKAEKV